MEVRRAGVRGQVPRHLPADGHGAPRRGRPGPHGRVLHRAGVGRTTGAGGRRAAGERLRRRDPRRRRGSARPHQGPDPRGRRRAHRSQLETLRLSGIDEDINAGGRYDAVKPRLLAIDRATGADEFRRLLASPDYVVNSVAAVTESGSLVLASGSGSQLPANAGGAAHAVWIVGAQKVVPDLSTALRRLEEHVLPLENARAQEVYGRPSAVNRLLVLNAEPHPGRGTVLLLREAVGY
ncbi:lactate utilization protein [Streptomyces tricolor]|nr:lactate utilization protein [Streptomyces tricolor]